MAHRCYLAIWWHRCYRCAICYLAIWWHRATVPGDRPPWAAPLRGLCSSSARGPRLVWPRMHMGWCGHACSMNMQMCWCEHAYACARAMCDRPASGKGRVYHAKRCQGMECHARLCDAPQVASRSGMGGPLYFVTGTGHTQFPSHMLGNPIIAQNFVRRYRSSLRDNLSIYQSG